MSKRNNETGIVPKRKASGKLATSEKAKMCKSIKQAKSSNLSKIPIISSPVDLVRKIVFRFTERDNKVDWYQGVVLKQVGRSAKVLNF